MTNKLDINLPITVSVKSKPELETKFTNTICVSDILRVIEVAVNAQPEPGRMTTIMLQ